tara:strand:+ start:3182 stop:3412 length:231 start_codon:yes stop_codon:yes gene_type:complete
MSEEDFKDLLDRHYESIIGFNKRWNETHDEKHTYNYTKEEHHAFFKNNEHVKDILEGNISRKDKDIDVRDLWYTIN